MKNSMQISYIYLIGISDLYTEKKVFCSSDMILQRVNTITYVWLLLADYS